MGTLKKASYSMSHKQPPSSKKGHFQQIQLTLKSVPRLVKTTIRSQSLKQTKQNIG